MLLIAKSLDELRFEELAALYRYDLEVAGCEDGMCELDDDWFLEKRSQFRTYLSARFFSQPDCLPDIRPFYAIWEEDGRYVSAVRVNVYEQGLLLEALQTGEAWRKQGYATALLNAVLEYLVQRGGFPVYAHVRNYKAYVHKMLERAGFRKILDYAVRKDPCEWPPYYYRETGFFTYHKHL